jgi:hypothetical protein
MYKRSSQIGSTLRAFAVDVPAFFLGISLPFSLGSTHSSVVSRASSQRGQGAARQYRREGVKL